MRFLRRSHHSLLKHIKNAGRFRRIYVYYATHTHTHASDRQKLYTSCNILTNKSLFFCVILKLSLSLLSSTFFLNNTNKMSTTPKDFTHLSAASIQTIAEAFGFVISDDVAKAFAPDVEYRLRDIIQEALKCTKRSRRNVLTTEVYFFMFLSLSLSLSRIRVVVEYLCSALDDDDDDDDASVVPKRNTHTNSFLSFQFKSLTLFCLNRT